jgi:hypothetical protein
MTNLEIVLTVFLASIIPTMTAIICIVVSRRDAQELRAEMGHVRDMLARLTTTSSLGLMTWQDVQVAANRMVEETTRSALEGVVRLPNYVTPAAYRKREPDSIWSLEFHRQVMDALAREMEWRKFKVEWQTYADES